MELHVLVCGSSRTGHIVNCKDNTNKLLFVTLSYPCVLHVLVSSPLTHQPTHE